MQHQFEFVAELTNGDKVHLMYNGKSSRHKKVKESIVKDLRKMYGILPEEVGDVYLKPVIKN